MENREVFELMLNKIEELTKENSSLKLKAEFYKKHHALIQSQENESSNIYSEKELDEIFNPDNYRFEEPRKQVGVKHEIRR